MWTGSRSRVAKHFFRPLIWERCHRIFEISSYVLSGGGRFTLQAHTHIHTHTLNHCRAQNAVHIEQGAEREVEFVPVFLYILETLQWGLNLN